MRILITGGAGFIGSYTVDALLAENSHDVSVIHDLSTGKRERPRGFVFIMLIPQCRRSVPGHGSRAPICDLNREEQGRQNMRSIVLAECVA
jgi:nucleoside-diphosphate-sugar epimerase